MLNYVLFFYIAMVCSVVSHELFHALFAYIYKIKITKIILGADLLMLRIRKVYISPFLFWGSVDASIESLLKHDSYIIAIFFFSGIIPNVIFVACAAIFKGLYADIVLLINVIVLITSLLPIAIPSDMNQFLKYRRSACK
jgi:hypothetical protein